MLLAAGCQRAETSSAATHDRGATSAVMDDLLTIVNDRTTPCATAKKNLANFGQTKSADIAAAKQAYAQAKAKGGPAAKAAARPIEMARPAINRFRRRCPGELSALTGILDQMDGGDISFEPSKDEQKEEKPLTRPTAAMPAGSLEIPDTPRPSPKTTPAGDTDVKPPKASDLAGYLKGIEGKGQLMARIETNVGKFECQLFEKKVPMTIANFVGLARGLKAWRDPNTNKAVKGPFFTGILFHRVIPDFMLQTGDPTGTGRGGPGYRFADEFDPSLKFDQPGRLAMANAGPGTNGSQFFITEKPTPWLNNHHTIFGQCDNLDLVKKIARVPKAGGDKPAKDIFITQVTIYRK